VRNKKRKLLATSIYWQDMKNFVEKIYWQDMKNFIGKTWKILSKKFNKICRFLLKQDEFGTNSAVDKDAKISVKIRPIFKRSNIGR